MPRRQITPPVGFIVFDEHIETLTCSELGPSPCSPD